MQNVDASLLTRIATGDRGALAALYDRYAARMTAVARTFAGIEREAEDLVHDVLLEIWRDAGDFDPARGAAQAWIFGRLRCRAIDRLRAPGHCRAVLRADVRDGDVGDIGDHDDASLAPDRVRAQRAVAKLPVAVRRVIELRYFDGLSSSEIAAQVRAPVGTVKSRIAAGLVRLRHELAAA